MEPLVVEFDVAAPPEHAFHVWAAATDAWWPRTHTICGDPAVSITFEPYPGGRVFERSGDGEVHEWGTVTIWEPPGRIAYRWHLFFDASEATDVEVTFTPVPGGTRVRLEQSGWERLGEAGEPRRAKTSSSWAAITELFKAEVESAG